MKFSIYIDQLTLQHWRGTGGARTDEQMSKKYRLDTNKFGRSINSLVSLDELREMSAAALTVRGDEILDEEGVDAWEDIGKFGYSVLLEVLHSERRRLPDVRAGCLRSRLHG